jgi:hypothetical protein
MKVLKQLFKEFWFPLLGAIGWVAFNKPKDLAQVISHFSGAFIFLSYFTSQFFRVKKQNATESSLLAIRLDIQNLLDDLKTKTTDLIGHVSGGRSFCMLLPIVAGAENSTDKVFLLNQGNYPLFDLRGIICDVDHLNEIIRTRTGHIDTANFAIECPQVLIPKQAEDLPCQFYLKKGDRRVFDISFQARNGAFTQELRFARVGGVWVHATRVFRSRPDELCHEYVDPAFPLNEGGQVDWKVLPAARSKSLAPSI